MYSNTSLLRFALPKGRMQRGVFSLLHECGIEVGESGRSYRPFVSFPNVETKILKPHNIVEMLIAGSRDLGFAGADWIRELANDSEKPVEIFDTQLDPVRLVAAAPATFLEDGRLPSKNCGLHPSTKS